MADTLLLRGAISSCFPSRPLDGRALQASDSFWLRGHPKECHQIGRVNCSTGKHPPEPRKDTSHIEDRVSSRKVAKLKKKRGVRDIALITVKRSDSKWSDSWKSQQATTLRDLDLQDMAMDSSYKPGQPPADAVTVDLSVQKVGEILNEKLNSMGKSKGYVPACVLRGGQTGWGFFVQAQVRTTTQQQCNRCIKMYLMPVNGSFQAWLSPTQDVFVHPQGTGADNDDPTVVYFPLGEETADLTAMVRDTIRLSHSTKAICSEACEKLGPRTWEFGGPETTQVVDSRWLPLLEAKQNLGRM